MNGDGVRAVNRLWDNLGTGKTKILEIFGGIFAKIPKFRGGDGGKNLGDFYHTTSHLLSGTCRLAKISNQSLSSYEIPSEPYCY